MSGDQPWRVAIVSSVLPIVEPLVGAVRDLGHEPVGCCRRGAPQRAPPPWGEVDDAKAPARLNLLFARDRHAVAPLLRGSSRTSSSARASPGSSPRPRSMVPA
jgi:hypothetical protein